MDTFTKENCDKLTNTCLKIISLMKENGDGEFRISQLLILGEDVEEFFNNPIVTNSGIPVKVTHLDQACKNCRYYDNFIPCANCHNFNKFKPNIYRQKSEKYKVIKSEV
jgi:hypothetical protein